MDDAFGLLGLKADASVTDVKAAYRGLGEFFLPQCGLALFAGQQNTLLTHLPVRVFVHSKKASPRCQPGRCKCS